MTKLKTALTLNLLAILLGLPQAVRAQDPGYALKFDGVSDFVRLSPTASMMGPAWQTTKTVSVWVKPTGSPSCSGPDAASCDVIFGDRPRTWGISRGVVGGLNRIWIWNFDGTVDQVGVEYVVGQWVQITFVHGGGQLKAYKNGVLIGTVNSGSTPTIQGQVLHFGGVINTVTKNWTFEGEIDEVRLWNVAQTEAQILQNLNNPLTGSEADLAAYYRMSNGTGLTVTDNSGHSWTGSLVDGGGIVPADGPITWVASGAMGGGGGPGNTPPVANPQSVTTPEDTGVAITLTGSDADPGEVLTFQVTTQPTHGVLTGAGANRTYTPAANYNGADSFAFVVNDGDVNSAPATVSLTVTPVADAPVAVDDVGSTTIDTAVVLTVLSNDTDVDLDTLTITAVGIASSGIVNNNTNSITYTPNAGFQGVDSFTYTITDGHGGFSTADVTVTVQPAGSGGYALRFDGRSDWVKLGKTSEMMQAGWQSTKTVELWVKPTGTSFCNVATAPLCDVIFGDRPRWWGISRGVLGGIDRIAVWNWDGTLKVIYVDYTPNEWTHIALVNGSGMLSAYKNGVLVGSVATGPTQQPSQAGAQPILHFGGIINSASNNWTFQGDIDEVRIWNTTRTAQEISQNMNVSLAGTEFGLAAYYRMLTGSGTTVTDDSGHGWTGTLLDGGTGVPADGPILWVQP